MTDSAMLNRRTTLKWVLAAGAAAALWDPVARMIGGASSGSDTLTPAARKGIGYGTDPDLLKSYTAGELWPLTMTAEQRRTAAVLCALIIPEDAHSPSAAQLNVHHFIDEWISAPYPTQMQDRELILAGFAWLDDEARRRFGKTFVALAQVEQTAVCDDICHLPKAKPAFAEPARFFARYRDLTAGGFYTTPQGRGDLEYVGNVALASFDGPPFEALRKVGLA
jgi:hypothetical protein